MVGLTRSIFGLRLYETKVVTSRRLGSLGGERQPGKDSENNLPWSDHHALLAPLFLCLGKGGGPNVLNKPSTELSDDYFLFFMSHRVRVCLLDRETRILLFLQY